MFLPLCRADAHLSVEGHGLIGDGTTAVLIGRDGAVSWPCIPRFDCPPLSVAPWTPRGGAFTVAPLDLTESRQYYEADSGVLVTELCNPWGPIRLTVTLTFRFGADLTEDSPAGRSALVTMRRGENVPSVRLV